MFYSRGVNNKVNRLHERCLPILYSDNISSFEAQLDKDKSASVHVKNLKTLTLEMFKAPNTVSAPMVSEALEKRNNF